MMRSDASKQTPGRLGHCFSFKIGQIQKDSFTARYANGFKKMNERQKVKLHISPLGRRFDLGDRDGLDSG